MPKIWSKYLRSISMSGFISRFLYAMYKCYSNINSAVFDKTNHVFVCDVG